MDKKTLFIFVDESGNFDFSPNGTKHFILTGVCTLNPLIGRDRFALIKYDLLGNGKDVESFHATDDKQLVRNRVFAEIKGLTDIEVHSVIVDKRKVHPSLYLSSDRRIQPDDPNEWKAMTKRVEERFYRYVCDTLLHYIVHQFIECKKNGITDIVIVLDKISHAKKREFVTKNIKRSIGNRFNLIPYIYFHQMKSDFNCQICDYCCWAIFAKWSRNETRPYDEIESHIMSEFDLFETESIKYY
ncbi:MAG: DUF3800 domain-containing protein [Betaproteobacteria bacterium AqS2]|uniref:DUF3800 domain-containing protein n=1 Tax=Candidatus Amphirhobacter heronislandensis TaxID=1732024 RepID=A0A930UBV1_9GAMM|nr:DUF3800 domain-containing protein [Betaproteobacteria bacterium AqS2]